MLEDLNLIAENIEEKPLEDVKPDLEDEAVGGETGKTKTTSIFAWLKGPRIHKKTKQKSNAKKK